MADLLTVSSISVRYGRPTVLRDVSLRLAKGELVCVIGQNGAGKSTLVKAIAGAVSPFQGSIRFRGTELVGRSPEAIARLGISYVPEGRHAFADMTVDENLLIGGYANPHPRRIPTLIEDAFHYFPRLRERRHSLAGRLSGGEQQMLVIARALMTGADFVIVDEPSLGLAPKIVAQVYDVLDGLRRGNQRGVKHILVIDFARYITCFFQDAVDRGAIDPLSLHAVHLEYLFKARDLTIRLFQVLFETALQGRIGRFRDHVRQVLRDLLLGIINVLQRMHEEIVQRFYVFGKKAHGFLL